MTMTTRGCLRIYLGAAPGVGQDLRHARRGPPPRRARDRRRGRLRRDARARRAPIAQLRDLEIVPRRAVKYRGRDVRGDGSRRDPAAAPAARPRRRARAHERARFRRARQALAGRRVAAGRGHRRAEHGQHPAPRVAQRRGARRSPACPSARRCPTRSCAPPSRSAGRHDAGGAAPADGARQHLPAREDRRGAGQLLPSGQPDRAARTRPALARRPRRGGDAALPRAARHHRHLGDARARSSSR